MMRNRPFPPPDRPPIMEQTWENLLFAHWHVPAEALASRIPAPMTLDTFEGRAWIGVTPFLLRGLRLLGLPPVPGLNSFAEVNVRTYVTCGGVPGIHFLSLDADHRLAVIAARTFFVLPYHRATIDFGRERGRFTVASWRGTRDHAEAAFSAAYQPDGSDFIAARGSLEHWLTERYCFFTVARNGEALRGDIDHAPWRLRSASGEVRASSLAAAAGVALPRARPLLHYSERQEVTAWTVTPVRGARAAS